MNINHLGMRIVEKFVSIKNKSYFCNKINHKMNTLC